MSKRLRAESTSEHAEPTPSSGPLIEGPEEAHTPKYASLDEPGTTSSSRMRCSLPPHKPLTFANYSDHETHYQQAHTNRCTECRKNFPSPHFLDLHIAENHDPIVAARRDKGDKTYACFVEGCDKVCSEWKKRRSHLVDKHGFPRNYDFFIVNTGIDGKKSMLRPGVDGEGHRKSSRERRESTVTESTQSTEATSVSGVTDGTVQDEDIVVYAKGSRKTDRGIPQSNAAMEDITASMSSLKMVPRSITFGKRKGRSGFAKS